MSGRPPRPAKEARLVREAVAESDPQTPREPLARDLARRVVAELAIEIDAEADPLTLALADLRRCVFPSPVHALATDPDVDTLSLFVEQRVAHVRDRNGRYLDPASAKHERQQILGDLEATLTRRYLRHLRNQNVA